MLKTLFLYPPLKKGDKGGFERIKSPLTPLFQRGEITCFLFPLLKRMKKRCDNRNSAPHTP